MTDFHHTTSLLAKSNFFYTIAIGMDSRYTYVSKNYDRNFSFLNDTLLGKESSITLHPDDVKICAEVGANCFKSPNELLPVTLRKLNGKGGFIFTQWEMKAIFNERNEPDGIFCVGYNISEHVATQELLNNANLELVNKDNKLHEIGLLQSHGVRRPLANILGLTGILASMPIDANLNNIKDMLIQSAEELDRIIKNITTITTVNSSKDDEG